MRITDPRIKQANRSTQNNKAHIVELIVSKDQGILQNGSTQTKKRPPRVVLRAARATQSATQFKHLGIQQKEKSGSLSIIGLILSITDKICQGGSAPLQALITNTLSPSNSKPNSFQHSNCFSMDNTVAAEILLDSSKQCTTRVPNHSGHNSSSFLKVNGSISIKLKPKT